MGASGATWWASSCWWWVCAAHRLHASLPGPGGKIATGAATSLGLLAAGVGLERLDRYRAFSRSLLGGGWALLYFTAFAAHNVEAARIVHDPAWATPLPVAVAAGMFGHSLRYRSQVVTGLAWGLAYFAIAVYLITAFSRVTAALLGTSMMSVMRG